MEGAEKPAADWDGSHPASAWAFSYSGTDEEVQNAVDYMVGEAS